MKRLPTFLAIIVALFFWGLVVQDVTGFGTECVDGRCYFWARGSLPGIFYGFAFGLLVLLLPRKKVVGSASNPVGFFRRAGVLYLDLFIILFAIGDLATLPALLVEAEYTGSFQWSYSREFSRDTDWLVRFPSALFIFGLTFYYHYRSLLLGRPTIGQYVMGYQIVSNAGPWTRRRALKRLGHTILNLCAWPVAAIMAARHEKNAFWWDLKTDSIAERFDYVGEDQEGLEAD